MEKIYMDGTDVDAIKLSKPVTEEILQKYLESSSLHYVMAKLYQGVKVTINVTMGSAMFLAKGLNEITELQQFADKVSEHAGSIVLEFRFGPKSI
jgi:hypothetical protein